MEIKTIAIIGGGASGLMAAIQAAKNKDNKVIIIEKNNRLGRKVLASGNGRCNFTNLNAAPYHYNNPEFAGEVLSNFTVINTLDFFESRGLMYTSDEQGRTYPISYNANTVLDILMNETAKLNIEIRLNSKVTEIEKLRDKFIIKCEDEEISADRVVFTVGSNAGLTKRDDISGILKNTGHKIIAGTPALTPLKTVKSEVRELSGIRIKAKISLNSDKKTIYEEAGEVLFKDEGISGIAIFNASLFYQREEIKEGLFISLNLLPEYDKNALKERFNTLNLPVDQFLYGIFNRKIADKILTDSGRRHVDNIIEIIKDMRFTVTGTYGLGNAQIAIGGISTEQVSAHSLESQLIHGLYFAGEALDIDGECGGYNLQWAWSSGAVAGKSAGKGQ